MNQQLWFGLSCAAECFFWGLVCSYLLQRAQEILKKEGSHSAHDAAPTIFAWLWLLLSLLTAVAIWKVWPWK